MPSDPEHRTQEPTEAQTRLSFIKKFDGPHSAVPADECREASGLLEAAIEQALTTHAGHTEGSMMTYLRLGVSFQDKSGITVVITTSSFMKRIGRIKRYSKNY